MADVTINQLTQGSPNKDSAIIPYSDGTTTYKTSPSGIVAASPGAVLQVKQTVVTTPQIFPLGMQVWSTVTNLSATITPLSLNNKILVDWSVPCGSSSGGGTYNISLRLLKTQNNITTLPFQGTPRSGSGEVSSGSTFITNPNYVGLIANKFLDSVSSLSPITYGFQSWCETNSYSIGGSWATSTSYSVNSVPYTLTLMEIAG